MGGGKRGGAEEEAEGGPEAAAANAARGTCPSSPHASTGGGLGRLRGRPERAQGGLGASRARRWCSPSPQLWPRKWRGSRERASPKPRRTRVHAPADWRSLAARHSGSEGKREGGGVCASAKTPTAATGSAVTKRARRPALGPSSWGREAGSSPAPLQSRWVELLARLSAPGWSWKERVLWRMRFYF